MTTEDITVEQLVAYVKAHALAHYEDGGWDVVVECYTDAAISDVLREEEVTTKDGAIEAFELMVDVWSDRQADARNSAF